MPTAAAVAHRRERVTRGVRRDQDDGSLLSTVSGLMRNLIAQPRGRPVLTRLWAPTLGEQ